MSTGDRQVRKNLARQGRAVERASAKADRAHDRAVQKRVRVLQRARARLPLSSAVAVGAAAVPLTAGGWTWLWYVSAGFGLRAVRAGATLLRPPEVPDRDQVRPGVALSPPVPPSGSVVYPAVRRLEAAKLDLARLLPLVAPAGRGAAQEARLAAAEADLALRWQASRLAAVEPHRSAPAALLLSLDQGVLAQEQLVAAVADLVEASADPYAGTGLQDATDALRGLAQGLRELR